MPEPGLRIARDEIVAKRPSRNVVDPTRPYAWLVEPERNATGEIVDIATLFLTNRECPFRCLMCDLWKNTLTESVASGEIPTQIRLGLEQLARDVTANGNDLGEPSPGPENQTSPASGRGDIGGSSKTASALSPLPTLRGERVRERGRDRNREVVLERSLGDVHSRIRRVAREIKLYNSGNFFDRHAIPVSDYEEIANLVSDFDTVIVENHPKLCGDLCFRFRDLIAPARLEVALGLETCHAPTLRMLNKGMTLSDFQSAVEYLHSGGIRTRVFLLQGLPLMDVSESTEWTLRSIDYAFDSGVDCCSVIAMRTGNGVMDELHSQGRFTPPTGESLEYVQETGVAKQRGRLFVDLWDADRFFDCPDCRSQRISRMRSMNLTQQFIENIVCGCCSSVKFGSRKNS